VNVVMFLTIVVILKSRRAKLQGVTARRELVDV